VADLDAVQMRHVLINLLSNAIDASPDGGTVEVVVDAVGGELRLSVIDHGPGIDPENVAAVFEPFFSTKAPGQGTGLGLSVARGIVEEHGGAVTVSAGEGGGARFDVRFPLAGP
jgi:signal transduction histidine kinase